MISIYMLHFTPAGWALEEDDIWSLDFRRGERQLMPGPSIRSTWIAPRPYWLKPMEPRSSDLGSFGSTAEFDAARFPGVAHILSKTCELLPMGGEATGHSIFRFLERTKIVDRDRIVRRSNNGRKTITSSDVAQWVFHEDLLVPNTVVHAPIAGAVAIEDESNTDAPADYRTSGLRKWVQSQGITGVQFEKIWDSTGSTIPTDEDWRWQLLHDPNFSD